MKTKILFAFLLLSLISYRLEAQNIGINEDLSDPHPSAMLDVKSLSKGFLMPRLSQAQRLGIANPATGLQVFDLNSNSFWFYDGTAWKEVGASVSATDVLNWNAAFGWGNHATAGYLKTYTETDPKIGISSLNFLPKWNGSALVSSIIFDNGNVGIGTGTPAYKLDVLGDINFSGNLYQNGSLFIGSQWKTSGSDIYYNTGNVGIGTNSPASKLVIQANTSGTDDALFVIKNDVGDTIFAVYKTGVYIFVDQASKAKAKGFVVKRAGVSTKGESTDIFSVCADSTVVTLSDSTGTKAKAKGFVVKRAGVSTKGNTTSDLFSINADSTVITLNDSTGTKAKAKGFIVKRAGTSTKSNAKNPNYLQIVSDSTNFYIRENAGNGQGFAVKAVGETETHNLLNINADSLEFSTSNNSRKIRIRNPNENHPLFTVDGGVKVNSSPDTIRAHP